MEIVPAIEEATALEFKSKLDKFSPFTSRVQVDFNDGSFAGFVTLRPEDVSGQISNYKDKIFFEAHLMVQKPLEMVYDLADSGFKKILIQYEIEDNVRGILEELRQMEVLVGLAIGPETTLEQVEPFEELIDTINVMLIHPGKQGQGLLPETLEKVGDLRRGNYQGEVEVDGGINAETISEVVATGPDALVVGSYIVSAESPRQAYETLVRLI